MAGLAGGMIIFVGSQFPMKDCYRIKISGLVQGVGFRPFIYRLASQLGLKGTVENRNDGVLIGIDASLAELNDFISKIQTTAPLASNIYSLHSEKLGSAAGYPDFSIVRSRSVSGEVTEVSPDICVCDECLADMKVQTNRIDYPFINCTNCGPRFTIIKDLPYDRDQTSMKPFAMCAACNAEYTDILDRRFHAQPVACKNCGPHYVLSTENSTDADFSELLQQTAALLEQGHVLAVKGLGGYFICCDAGNEAACRRIREFKNREGKPFAMMFRDMSALRNFAMADPDEEALLTSWRRPIVLLKQKRAWHEQLNSRLVRIGCMLPYMPIHFLLFEKLKLDALVMTSGNISEEPILIDDKVALTTFLPSLTAVLSYNREIANRCDDSVLQVVNEKPRMVRRSRGYVPAPVRITFNSEGILACGAELKNTFALGKGNQAILSQHIGDLKNPETFDFYTETMGRFSKLFRFTPSHVACDLHPDYLSSVYAESLHLPLTRVQHHHAHIASVLAEHQYDGQVIGVSLDGTGLGDDGAIWGGEFLLADLQSYTRAAHFQYVPMPGGDKAANEPWRMGVAYLHNTFGGSFTGFNLPFLDMVGRDKVNLLLQGVEAGLNCPPTSSCGRLFDAAAAISGICTHHSFDAEGPMRLEAAIDKDCQEAYPFTLQDDIISFLPLITEMVSDVLFQVPVSIISARFHNALIQCIVQTCQKVSLASGLKTVALSGGSFMNAYLLAQTEKQLSGAGFTVLSNLQVPSNDGGIALGQLAVAAACR